MPHLRARRAITAIAVALFGAAVASGCASEVPSVPEVPASASVSAETPPVPTPTPTAESMTPNDPSNLDSWVVTEQGIGPVLVSANYDEALDAVSSTPIEPFDGCDGVAYGTADDNAYNVMIVKDRRDGTDEVVEVTVNWNGDTMGVGPRTEEDLGLGSTKAQVLGTYERAQEQSSGIKDRSFVTIAGGDDQKLVFTYVDGYDGAVSVSVVNTQEPAYEPCA